MPTRWRVQPGWAMLATEPLRALLWRQGWAAGMACLGRLRASKTEMPLDRMPPNCNVQSCPGPRGCQWCGLLAAGLGDKVSDAFHEPKLLDDILDHW